MKSIRYSDYQKMIAHLARKFSSLSGLEVTELSSEGNVIFIVAASEFQRKKGIEFSTYLWRCLRNGLLNYIKQNKKWVHDGIDDQELRMIESPHGFSPERNLILHESISSLSPPAQHVVKLVLEGGVDLSDCRSAKAARGVIIRHMREEYGASWPTVWKAMGEVKSMVKEL